MELIKRQGIIVWLYTLKHINQLKSYGYVHYSSDKMKYALLYIDQSLTEKTVDKLKQLHFVRNVELSYRDTIDMTFKEAIGIPEVSPEETYGKEFFEAIAKEIKEHQAQD